MKSKIRYRGATYVVAAEEKMLGLRRKTKEDPEEDIAHECEDGFGWNSKQKECVEFDAKTKALMDKAEKSEQAVVMHPQQARKSTNANAYHTHNEAGKHMKALGFDEWAEYYFDMAREFQENSWDW